MSNSKISIIVPIYNAGKPLEQCIESIVNQTYKDIEIILVNDGSTDESLNISKRWKEKDNRIIVIDKPNGGLASSRNAGLEKASGEYIGFVDHDDYIEPEMYEEMLKDMRVHSADIVMCSSTGLYDDGNKKKSYVGYDCLEVSGQEATIRMLNFEKLFCSSVWSKLYKKSIIGNIRFVDEIVLGEDYYFNGRIYPLISKFYYDNRAFYNYRIVEGSMSRGKVNEHFFDKYKVAEKLSDYYEQFEFIEKKDIEHFRFSMAYEILYGLYINNGFRQDKNKWKRIFKKEAQLYKGDNLSDKIKIFLMKHCTCLYVSLFKNIK